MRQIIVKYVGSCGKCGNDLSIGAPAMYEKRTGIFCIGCEPTDIEDIRTFRQEKANRRAERYEEWAHKREGKASAQLNSYPQIRHDIAFNTQPGHIPFRARMNKADQRAIESLEVAEGMREKAQSLRHVRVVGDAERKRQKVRDALDTMISKGSKVYDAVFGEGEVVGVYKKSYRIKFASKVSATDNFVCSRDKSFVRLVSVKEVQQEEK